MKSLNIIKLVQELLASETSLEGYNQVRSILKENFLHNDVVATMYYVRGEYTKTEEKLFLSLVKYF
jgi:hypothetical protein